MEKSSVHSTGVDFRLLFESVPGLFLVLAPGLTIIAVSNLYLDTNKTTRKELIGRHIFDVLTDNTGHAATSVSNLRASLNKVLKTKKADIMLPAVQLLEKSRGKFEERYFSRVNTPVLDAFGEISYIIHSVDDVTELMELKQKESEQNKVLLSIDAERAQNAEFIEQKNAALAYSNAELEAFSYSVSHDLRAPLRAIYGYTKILSDNYMHRLDEEGLEMMDNVIKNVKKMGLLIDGLLAFARVGRTDISMRNINMVHVVQKTLLEFRQSEFLQLAKINILPLPPAKGDYSMLGQVFSNLISNALKYSHTNPNPVIEIGSFEKDGANVYYVKDNGVGFEMKYYNKLFGIFQRLHSTNDFEGNGVGLALVKRIVTKHGGRVWAESEIGEGATFYFSLPA